VRNKQHEDYNHRSRIQQFRSCLHFLSDSLCPAHGLTSTRHAPLYVVSMHEGS
jgi:hypothetical protein